MALRAFATGLAMLALTSGAPSAQDQAAGVFAGKTIKIIAGVGPGGSNSLYAESLARHMGRFLPGSPQVIVQHMPGANGLLATNYIATKAARDGTEFTIANRNIGVEPLLGNRNALFDPLKLAWLGSANVENSACIAWHEARVKTFADLRSMELVAGGTGADALEVLFPRVLNRMLGTKYRVVNGYAGSPQVLLAMEKGEVEAFCGIGWTYLKLRKSEWVEQRKFNILFQMALEKHPDLPDTPLLRDFARDDDDRRVLDFLLAPQGMGRPFVAPPLDAGVTRLLREAFMNTLADPAYLKDAERTGLEVRAVSGEAVRALIERVYATPPALVERAKGLLAE